MDPNVPNNNNNSGSDIAQVPSVPQQHSGFVAQESKFSFSGMAKIIAFGLGGIVLLAGLGTTVLLSQQRQDIQQHASAISDVIGYLDNRTAPSNWCTAITGWTCDRSDPSKPIVVNLYAPNPYKAGVTHTIGTAIANMSSSDEAAIAQLCGATTGNKKSYPHRFSLQIPASLKNNTAIKIYVYGIGLDGVHNPLLTGSGTAVTCAPPKPSPTAVPSVSPTTKPSVSPTAKPSTSPSPTTTQKLGDINGDGKVDIVDYQLLIACYGDKFSTDSCTAGSAADLNEDGAVDGVDYNIFLRAMIGQ